MKKSVETLVEILISIAAAAIAALLIITEPFYTLDAMLCDAVCSQMNGTGSDIKLIAIDEETLAEYGAFSEWSREKCAELADVLYSDENNRPAVLAFDVMFTGAGDPSADAALVNAFEGKNIITASNLVYRGETMYSDGKAYYDKWNIKFEERPFAALDAVVNCGYANVQLSADGFVRSTQLFTEYNGLRYSFSAEIYRQYMAAVGKEAVFPKTNGRNQVMFSYSGRPGEFQRFSLKDVLNGEVDKRNFADCIVIVGAYASGLSDSYHTPADRDSDMYGAEINANIVRALMTGKTSRKPPAALHAAIAAAVVFIYVFTAWRMNMYFAALSVIWVFIADIGAGFVLSRNGVSISLIYPLIVTAAAALLIFAEKYISEILRKRRILQSFGKYLSPLIIEKLAKDGRYDLGLGVERRDVCVLFVDIRGFTPMSENLPPEEIAQILNVYLSEVTNCVFDHSGMLDKFIGDAAMAVFNAPTDLEDYEYKALCAAVDIKNAGVILEERLLKKHGRSVSFGIGLNCGEAVVGNIGSDKRMDYTAIGDTVNTAARLEARAAGGEILISETLYERVKDRIEAHFKEEMALKGKKLPVKVYSVTGIKNNTEEV